MGNNDFRKLKIFSLVLIPLSLYMVFIIGGFILIAIESLGYIPAYNLNVFTLDFYKATYKEFLKASVYTFIIASISSIISVILGVFLAQRVAFYHSKFRFLKPLAYIIIILPYLYVVFLVLTIFRDSGFVSKIFSAFHLEYSNKFLYQGFGIVLVFITKGTSFVFLYVLNILSKTNKAYFNVASTLGVGRKYAIRNIYIPVATTPIVWSGLVLFAYFIGSYEVFAFLTNSKTKTVSMLVYKYYTSSSLEDFPKALAINIMLLITTSIAGLLYAKLTFYIINRRFK